MSLLRLAGLGLLPFAALLVYLAARERTPAWLIWGVSSPWDRRSRSRSSPGWSTWGCGAPASRWPECLAGAVAQPRAEGEGRRGRRTVNVVPCSASERTETVPPWAWTTCRVM